MVVLLCGLFGAGDCYTVCGLFCAGDCYTVYGCMMQVVVLARVVIDRDQVMLTASGVSALVNILKGEREDNALILAGG